jgi:hypothetical protein
VFFVLFIFIVNLSAQHPNLDGETIILDEEALRTINDYKNPDEKIRIALSPHLDENKTKANQIKVDLVKAFTPTCKLFLEEEYRFFGLTNDNQIIKIGVPISGTEIDVVKFNINKKIKNVDELILVTQMFTKAYVNNIADGIWEFEDEECKYSDTIYSQFSFSNIRWGILHDVEKLLKKYL